MPSSSYYDHQAELCMKMALVATTREERTRLVILANDYKEKASVPIQSSCRAMQPYTNGRTGEGHSSF